MNYMYDEIENQLECSSGCESGWTVYLEHSSSSVSTYNHEKNDYIDGRRRTTANYNGAFTRTKHEDDDDDDDDEDMSMVSDASSGPPHLHEEEEIYGGNRHDTVYSDESLCKKKMKNEKRRRKVQEHSSLLDDTASSPFLDLSNKSNFTVTRNQLPYVENVLEYSQGYSTTQFEVRPSYQEHYDFFQASTSANQLQQNQWFEGKRW